MKLNWLVIVALGVALAGCGEVTPPDGQDSVQANPEQAEGIFVEETRPVQETEGVSAMAYICRQYAYINGACGCDAGSFCGYTRKNFYRDGSCSTSSCTGCEWAPFWIQTGTSCVASTSCTSC